MARVRRDSVMSASREGCAQDTVARSRLVARDSRGNVLGSREVLFGEGLTTQLREWIEADNWPGLCEGMTISVEPANAESQP